MFYTFIWFHIRVSVTRIERNGKHETLLIGLPFFVQCPITRPTPLSSRQSKHSGVLIRCHCIIILQQYVGNPIYWTKKKSLIGNSLHILFGCPRAIGVRGKKRGHTKGRFNPGFIEPRGRGFSYPSSLRFPLYILKREKILGTCENGDTLKRGKVRKNGTLLPLLFPDSCCYFFVAVSAHASFSQTCSAFYGFF